jgi:hypothetical protein
MIYFSVNPSEKQEMVSVPPLSYVKKREATMNAEVFVDAINLLRKQIRPNRS